MHPWDDIDLPEEKVLDRLLAKTKGQLFLHSKGAGFLGSLLCNHNYVWDYDHSTAWCNGKTIGFNPRFFMWLKPECRLTLLVHELWHTGYDHISRLGKRDPRLWNIAADYVINNKMDEWGFSFENMSPLLDHKYDDMTTEQIYDLLVEEGGFGTPQPDPGQSGSGDGSTPPPPNGGEISPLCGDVRPVDDPVEQAQIKASLVKAIQASKMAKEAGVIPGEVELHIEGFLNPQLPWETLLARFYTELSKDDFSWKRPSRRHQDEYLPSPDGDNQLDHLIYYLDVSGSVTDEQITRFFSEVRYIHESIRPKKLTMVTFDTEIHDEISLEEGDPFDQFTIIGRGGTDLEPVREHILQHKPTAAVVFSDLYCRLMDPNPSIPILWAVIDNRRAKVNFGKMVHISVD